MDFAISYGKGFLLGGFMFMLGVIFDRTISKNTMEKLHHDHFQLCLNALHAIQTNLLVISPVIYAGVDQTLLTHESYMLQPIRFMGMLSIHSLGYYVVHFCMHKNMNLYKYHKFHHEFDHLLMPSIGNAVSIPEYLSAYVAPFIMGAYILRPNETTFASSIGLIAFMNLIIHCQEMEHVPWLSFFVSPKNHIEHHKVRLKHYAAPTINVDYLLEHC